MNIIHRIGRYEVCAGLTTQYGYINSTLAEGTIGLHWIRLIGGVLVYALIGRFGVFVGGWGPNER